MPHRPISWVKFFSCNDSFLPGTSRLFQVDQNQQKPIYKLASGPVVKWVKAATQCWHTVASRTPELPVLMLPTHIPTRQSDTHTKLESREIFNMERFTYQYSYCGLLAAYSLCQEYHVAMWTHKQGSGSVVRGNGRLHVEEETAGVEWNAHSHLNQTPPSMYAHS